MRVYFGSERCVLAFPRLGFVLKFPSLHRASWVWRPFWRDEDLSWKMKEWSSQAFFFIKRAVTQNRRERKIWRILRDPFLAPTYFSFFGFVNLQAYFQVFRNKKLEEQFKFKMQGVLTSSYEVVVKDAHSWYQIANYSIQPDSSLRKLDYGGENDLEVLKHFLPALRQIRIR